MRVNTFPANFYNNFVEKFSRNIKISSNMVKQRNG